MTNPDNSADEPVNLDEAPPEDTTRGNSEAAAWRTKFRAKEVEHIVLEARLDAMTRTEIQRLASEVLADGQDFWHEPVDLGDVCDEVGLPDPVKVKAHAEALVAAHGHWARKAPARTPSASTVTSDGSPYDSAPKPSWIKVITGGAGG